MWGDPSSNGNGYSYGANNPWSNVDPTGEGKLIEYVLLPALIAIPAGFTTGGGVGEVPGGMRGSEESFRGAREAGHRDAGSVQGLMQRRSKTTEAKVVMGGVKISEESIRVEIVIGGSYSARDIPAGEVVDCAPNVYRMAKLCPGHIPCPPNYAASPGNDVGVEELRFTHEGLTRQK